MITISATTDLTTTAVVALSGPTRIALGAVVANDSAVVYEERADGEYYPIRVPKGADLALTACRPSMLFEGYGNFKFLLSRADIVVGYDDGGIS